VVLPAQTVFDAPAAQRGPIGHYSTGPLGPPISPSLAASSASLRAIISRALSESDGPFCAAMREDALAVIGPCGLSEIGHRVGAGISIYVGRAHRAFRASAMQTWREVVAAA
jgi:hypothetical protein